MSDIEALRDAFTDDPDIPETVRGFLKQGAPLEEIRLDQHGNWWHAGEAFENQRLIKLFHRSLRQTAAGNWVLEIAPYTYPIVVELTGAFVERILAVDPVTRNAQARMRDGSLAEFNLDQVSTDGDRVLATHVAGQPARLVDTAYRQLTEELDVDDNGFCTTLDGLKIVLQTMPNEFFAQSRSSLPRSG